MAKSIRRGGKQIKVENEQVTELYQHGLPYRSSTSWVSQMTTVPSSLQ